MKRWINVIGTLIFLVLFVSSSWASIIALHPSNPRLLVGMDGRPLVLFGHQVFSEITDNMLASDGTMGPNYPVPGQDTFDLSWYITWLKARKMNYVRGWSTFTTGNGTIISSPLVYPRVSGYGNAADGGLKFNLNAWDETYFTRLSTFVSTLQTNNIYYSFMFFEPYAFNESQFWPYNVFKGSNNIEGYNVDANSNGRGMEFFFSPSTELKDRQKAYIRKVIDTLYNYDNVIYEIANQLGYSTWQPEMVAYIRSYEASKGSRQHLILIAPGGISNDSGGWSVMSKTTMQLNNGDIYSYSGSWNTSFGTNPPVITSETTIVHPLMADLDHMDATGEHGWLRDYIFPWRAFTRGYNFSTYDDPFNGGSETYPDDAIWEAIRKNEGLIAYYAGNSLDLANLTPSTSTSICSTGYVRYKEGSEYFALQPLSGNFSIYLPAGDYKYDWIRVSTGTVYSTDNSMSSTGAFKTFSPPIANEPFAVYVHLIPGVGQSVCAQQYTTYYITSDDVPPSVITKLGSLAEAQQNVYLRAGYLDVTLYDGVGSYHVDKTGVADSTTGLQKALEDANAYELVAFFPSGTYKIASTLRVLVKRYRHRSCGNSFNYPLIMEGSTLGSRPVIKLVDSSTDFGDTTYPRPVLHICQATTQQGEDGPPCSQDAVCQGGPTCECDEGAGVGFNNSISNIDIDVGSGNPAAVGLRFNHAQGSFLRDIKIYSSSGSTFFAGIKDMPDSGGGMVNVEIEGGQYGVINGTLGLHWGYPIDGVHAGNETIHGNAWPVIVNTKLTNQTSYAIRSSWALTMTFVGLEIKKATTPVIYSTSTAPPGAALNIWDAKIEVTNGGSDPIIWQSGDGSIYLNNVYTKGAINVVNGNGSTVTCSGSCTTNWTKVSEFARMRQSTVNNCQDYAFIDGSANKTTISTVTQNSGAPPNNISLQHKLTVPSFEDPDVINVRDLPTGQCAYGDVGWYVNTPTVEPYYWIKYIYSTCDQTRYNTDKCVGSPTPVSSHDDTAAIQNAINTYSKVFLPKGFYNISNTLTLKANTKFFGVGSAFVYMAPSETWNPNGVETPVVTTVNDANARTYIGTFTTMTPWVSLGRQWFNVMDWRAGRRSVIFDYSTLGDLGWKQYVDPLPGNPMSKYKFSGNGGGRWFFGWMMGEENAARTGDVNFRLGKFYETTEPVTVYGYNVEHAESVDGVHIEFYKSKNVRIFSCKRETRGYNAYLINNSENIIFSSDGGHGVPALSSENYLFKVLDSNKVLLTSLGGNEYGGTTSTAYRVLQKIGSAPNTGVFFNDVVTVYKRGSIDYNVWNPMNDGGRAKFSNGINGVFR